MVSVIDDIHAPGAKVEHIPWGCTGLCQLVSVGIKRLVKVRLCNVWVESMIDVGFEAIMTIPTSYAKVAHWICAESYNINPPIVQKSWHRNGV